MLITDNVICCHNCGWYGNPIKFIQDAEGLTYNEIVTEAEDYDILPSDITFGNTAPIQIKQASVLPRDSINLCDPSQITYYSDNKIVSDVYSFANKRNLLSAVNRPKTLWLSLTDNVHKNRLILPFYNSTGDIEFYQTRTVFPNEKLPKYLSKIGGDKTLFNINNIQTDLDTVFIFEGPIDACFVKNGIAVAGIQENSDKSFSIRQQEQLKSISLLDKIWVLDSQWIDRASQTKTHKLIEQGHSVFIWPENYGKRFKDFNDMAIALDINEIPYKFILNNTYTGLKARAVLANLDNT